MEADLKVVIYDLDDLVVLCDKDGTSAAASATYMTTKREQDVTWLCRAVDFLQPQLDQDQEGLEPFLSCFSILASEVLASVAPTRSTLPHIRQSCHALAAYLLTKLRNRNPTDLSIRLYLAPLSSFCSGEASLSRSERRFLIETLKNSKFPEGIQMSSIATSKQPNVRFDSTVISSEESTSEVGRPQTDLTNLLLEQLQSPLEEFVQYDHNQDQGRISPTDQGNPLKKRSK